MLGEGDDAGHCSSGLSAQNYDGVSAEDRATLRRWICCMIVFYVSVLLVAGGVAIASYNDVGLTQLANLYAHATTAPSGPDKNSSGAIRPPAKAANARQ